MRIDISEVRKQRNKPFGFHFCEQFTEELPDNTAYAGPVSVEVTLRSDSSGLTGRLRMSVPMRYRCSRCLSEFEQELSRDWEVKLLEREPGDEAEQAEDWLLITDDHIDLRDTIREAVILAVPFRPLCSPDCRGICPGCGAELNREHCHCQGEDTDPRWEKLKQLKV
ncbi:MAG: DUF177 domain-containing protein [Syntrophomonadaceae bacterium]|nr:DUF177 domain-containing protein [Syntrophomonadaceae bacterium]